MRRALGPAVLLAVVAGVAGVAEAQTRAGANGDARSIPPERIEAVDRFVARSRERLGLPGVAVSIATADSVLLAAGYGRGTSTGGPITAHTPFYIGSVTKTLTAALVAQLAADGRIDLDAPIETYLPDFTMRAPFAPRSITIRDLLTHRSGFSQWSGHDGRAQREGTFAHLAPSRAPGVRTEYSSLNFIVLGRVVEAVTGSSFPEHIAASLFQPLGMHDAFAGASDSARAGAVAHGHQSWFGIQIGRAEPDPPLHLIPAGFVAASAIDLARYGGTLIGRGEFANERLLDSSAVAAMIGPLDTAGRALAWGRSREGGTLMLEHAGNARTMSARVRLLPERGYAIAVAANTNSGPFFPATGDLMNGIQAILDGESAPVVWPRERLFKGALFIGTALTLVQLARRAHRWDDAGRPTHIDGSMRAIAPLALEVTGGAVLLFGVPRFFGVPLGTMHEYFPDLGVALVTSAVAGAAGGLLSAWTRSAARQ